MTDIAESYDVYHFAQSISALDRSLLYRIAPSRQLFPQNEQGALERCILELWKCAVYEFPFCPNKFEIILTPYDALLTAAKFPLNITQCLEIFDVSHELQVTLAMASLVQELTGFRKYRDSGLVAPKDEPIPPEFWEDEPRQQAVDWLRRPDTLHKLEAPLKSVESPSDRELVESAIAGLKAFTAPK